MGGILAQAGVIRILARVARCADPDARSRPA
jgi:hypothetical protein